MGLPDFSQRFLPEIETQIIKVIESAKIDQDESLYQMLGYHLGWFGTGAGERAQGKRIRPLITLLVAETVGGDYQDALPAAAAVEILHNFSLIHDDIEDQSDKRRGRETLWKIHGIPIALNAGDAMFSLAFIAFNLPGNRHSSDINFQASSLLAATCLALTKGQHMDISFETQTKVSTDDYLAMIKGKTAALLAASMQLGALLGGAPIDTQQAFYQVGINIGLAFQVYDDIIGIWGDSDFTGKSAATDLITRKKTLPILYGLEQNGEFSRMWQSDITTKNAPLLAEQLMNEGALRYAKKIAGEYTSSARNQLAKLSPLNSAGEALAELISTLIQRDS
ncbi:MAG: polyprenyl synthetase family protein [Anaerolineales bacterium]|nr:polyprenyl synthetase family protein [Anaerolineales bacterium]